MPQKWPALRAQLEAAVRRHSFLSPFNALRSGSATLARFPEPAALLDHLHRSDGELDDKDAILLALAEAAQREDAHASASITLLMLGLWPGLDAARSRLRRFFSGALDDLDAEISAELARQARRLRADRVSRVAATITRNVERDVRRRRLAELRRAAASDELDEARHTAPSAPGVLALILVDHEAESLQRLEEGLARLIGDDAKLVVDIVVRGAPQREAAAALGLSTDAGRKRNQRALARLKSLLSR